MRAHEKRTAHVATLLYYTPRRIARGKSKKEKGSDFVHRSKKFLRRPVENERKKTSPLLRSAEKSCIMEKICRTGRTARKRSPAAHPTERQRTDMQPFLFSAIYRLPLIPTAILAVTFLLLWGILSGRKYPNPDWRVLNAVLFGFWLAGALYYTLLSRDIYPREPHLEPFYAIRRYFEKNDKNALREFWMNILLFIPGGAFYTNLLPAKDKTSVPEALRRCALTLLTGLAFTSVIEAIQWRANLGQFETDDLIANVAGTFLGTLPAVVVSIAYFLYATDRNPFRSKFLRGCVGLLRRFREQIAYIFCGGTTTFVNWSVYFISASVLHYLASDAIAWIVSVLFSFAANRTLVFQSEVRGFFPILKEGALFVAGRLFTFATELLLHWIGVEVFGIPADVMKFIIAVAVAFLNYAFGKLVVFRKRKPGKAADGTQPDGEE